MISKTLLLGPEPKLPLIKRLILYISATKTHIH
jgi:hypothetical protein